MLLLMKSINYYCVELLKAEWPESLLKHPLAAPQRNKNGNLIFNGLRLQMGMHISMLLLIIITSHLF